MKTIRIILAVLHGFVGVGAAAGGMAAILDPASPLDAPVTMLANSPFSSFLIPGILLFGVIGVGNLGGLTVMLIRKRAQGYAGIVTGCALVVWIVVQCIMIRSVVALHVVFFTIGLIQATLGTAVLFRYRQFPANFIVWLLGER